MHSLWPSSCRVDFRTTLCFAIPSRSPHHCHRLTLPFVRSIAPSRTHSLGTRRGPQLGLVFTPWQLLGPHSASRETKDLNRLQTCSLASSTTGPTVEIISLGSEHFTTFIGFLSTSCISWIERALITLLQQYPLYFGTKFLCWICAGRWWKLG